MAENHVKPRTNWFQDLPHPALGAHTSIAGGVHNAIRNGADIGADVVQIFAKNQRQWRGRAYTEVELETFRSEIDRLRVYPVVIHDAYLINLASPDPLIRSKSIDGFADELVRARQLRVPYLLTHPGSHLGDGEGPAVKRIAESISRARSLVNAEDQMVLLEITAGQGSNMGYRFEHLRDIIDAAGDSENLGVCIDTCHLFAAGYDMRTASALNETLSAFDRIVGFSRLRLLHLNDSLGTLGSRIDRHRQIGAGEIGLNGFRALINHEKLRLLPMIMEIPGGPAADRTQLELLHSMIGQEVET